MAAGVMGGSRTLPKKGEKLEEPRDYLVVLLNDDFTTREFVVEVLMGIFHKNRDEATKIMLNVHYQGRGVVGVYTWDIAHTKAKQVHSLAEQHEFPLRCIVEET
jgi:ATP-dependent Clp protease adaptor protein ClpS